MNWQEKLKLKSVIQIFDDPRKEELDKKIRKHIQEKGYIKFIEGFYGDQINSSAYVEEEIIQGGSIFTKVYGCSYLWNGIIDKNRIDKVAALKRVFMEDITFISKIPFIIPLFFFKKIREAVIERYARIYEADLIKVRPQNNEFSRPAKELMRAGYSLLKDISVENINITHKDYLKSRQAHEFIDCLIMFIDADNSYRLPVQDIFGELKNPSRKEILRVLDIGISRALHIKNKLIIIRNVLFLLLLIPRFKKIAFDFINNLDLEKIRINEADWYFCLGKSGYNYKDISFEDRQAIRQQIDKEKGHILFGV